MKNSIDQYTLRIPFGSNRVDVFNQYAAKPTDFCEKFKEEDSLLAKLDLTEFEKTTPKTMNRKIQIQLHRSQMEILQAAVLSIEDEDLNIQGSLVKPMTRYFITRVSDRITSRLENRETNKRKFKISFHPAEVAALTLTFMQVEYRSTPGAALLQTVLMELDRNI